MCLLNADLSLVVVFDNVIDALKHFKSTFMGIINNIAPIKTE